LLSDYYVLVYPRRGVDAAWLCSKYDLQLVDAPMVEISSTMLRQAKAMGADLSAFVPHGVDFFS
jgi:nicotinate-nucleotide adenylyltransferase